MKPVFLLQIMVERWSEELRQPIFVKWKDVKCFDTETEAIEAMANVFNRARVIGFPNGVDNLPIELIASRGSVF